MPFMRDIDAPNTSWRPASEPPIPVLLGRYSSTAALFRFVSCRPLDGHSRTDATFLRKGTKPWHGGSYPFPFQYWPGWKRGALITRLPGFVVLPYAATTQIADRMFHADPWWLHQEAGYAAWTPWLAYGTWSSYRYVRDYSFRKHYLKPLEGALINALRTRQGVTLDIPRNLVRAHDAGPTGRVYLPSTFVGADGDRENLLEACRGRLASPELEATWVMEGAKPYMGLYVPSQPPKRVTWADMMTNWNSGSPYLGQSANGAVMWDLGESSPHIGVVGTTGSGKSELVAWIVAQFLRGGAGCAVLDPKGTSHRWLLGIPEVLYCGTPALLTEAVMALDAELSRRAATNLASPADQDFPRLVVLLEERNSLQDALRGWWKENAPSGRRGETAPAINALARLGSMGRSLNINLVMAAQESAKAEIGTKANFGAWAIAGRMNSTHWRTLMGTGGKKPGISAKPGVFGYVVSGDPTVFQAAFPDLKRETRRLIQWATSGDALYDIRALLLSMTESDTPSSETITPDNDTIDLVTLREMSSRTVPYTTLTGWRQRGYLPPILGYRGKAALYDRAAMAAVIDLRGKS